MSANRTTVTLFGQPWEFPSQQDAFVWVVEKFLRMKADLFTDPKSAHICRGARGDLRFARSTAGMIQPAPLANEWFAELCLSNPQKVGILDDLARCVGLKRPTDWDWRAESRRTPDDPLDVDTLFRELDAATSIE
jgi:hypothetical protein